MPTTILNDEVREGGQGEERRCPTGCGFAASPVKVQLHPWAAPLHRAVQTAWQECGLGGGLWVLLVW